MRLIDADALRVCIMGEPPDAHYPSYYADLVDKAPTLDVQPVRRGEWKYFHKQNRAVCTQCSFERNLDADFGAAVSCPNCGADMRGVSHGTD